MAFFVDMNLSGLQIALIAAVLLGISCGLLGSFVVVRRIALVGDALSHAVFPGVVAGFMWSEDRHPLFVFMCAVVAGLLGVGVVRLIEKTTRLKSDAALGIVLAVFFALGVVMDSMSNQAGVRSFLYGQAAAIGLADLKWMFGVTVLVLLTVATLSRPLLVVSFDEGYSRTIGYPVRILQAVFYCLLAFAIVVAMQAVGVILVSAMLVTPAATAYLLTDRFGRMLAYSVAFGIIAGVLGCYVSASFSGIATGPVMALSAAFIFGVFFVFAPRHGVLAKFLRRRGQQRRIWRENLLKAIYQVLEKRDFHPEGVHVDDIAQRRRATVEDIRSVLKLLVSSEEVTVGEFGEMVYLTPSGKLRATEMVRNHRLWELYLTNEANYAADHVHDDAEKVEHILGPDMVRKLERDLAYPSHDPHGSPIPSADAAAGAEEGSRNRKSIAGYKS